MVNTIESNFLTIVAILFFNLALHAGPQFNHCIVIVNKLKDVNHTSDPKDEKSILYSHFTNKDDFLSASLPDVSFPEFNFWSNVVKIEQSSMTDVKTHGTGVYLGKFNNRHFVLTARHVIETSTQSTVVFDNGERFPVLGLQHGSEHHPLSTSNQIDETSVSELTLLELGTTRRQDDYLRSLQRIPIVNSPSPKGSPMLTIGFGLYDTPNSIFGRALIRKNLIAKKSWALSTLDSDYTDFPYYSLKIEDFAVDDLDSDPCHGMALGGDSGGPRFIFNQKLKRFELSGVTISSRPHNPSRPRRVKFGKSSSGLVDASPTHQLIEKIRYPKTLKEPDFKHLRLEE